MKIRNMILVAGMAVVGGTMFAGCGSNPCQDLVDGVTKASGVSGCSTALKSTADAFKSVDADNCDATDQQAAILEAEAACFNAVTKCDTKGLTTLSTCLQKALTAQ